MCIESGGEIVGLFAHFVLLNTQPAFLLTGSVASHWLNLSITPIIVI